ncbi:MAG: hypothetical protein DBY14_01785 [Escherichia coli]|nr:MAG: hypothetical protein DBY14_01785 [Escherichia coli]
MKRFLSIFLAIAIIFSFASCKNEKNEKNENNINISQQSQSQTENKNRITAQDDTKDESETSSKDEKQSSASSDKSNTKNDKNNSSNTNASKKPNNNNNGTQNNTQANSEVTEETQKPEQEYIYCTVEIDCSEIVKNKDNFNKEQQVLYDRYVDGKRTILSPVTVKVKNKSSAYKATELACKQNGIKMTKKNSGFGIYIVGFDGINEKMFGKTSGWHYYVNGKSPSFSCSAYELKDGDKVSFIYTCNG